MINMHRRICFIPLDSRPVCYDLPKRLAHSAGIELCLPSPKLLGSGQGDLKTPGDFKALSRWVKNHLFENDPIIVALDTIAYGGLIPSRINTDPLDVLEDRIDKFFKIVKAPSLYGFSSILRIPNYNFSEEEPDYWDQYGKALYQHSYETHESGQAVSETASHIPPAVLSDFLSRREKNYQLNQHYIDRLTKGQLDYLVFCQDDTGQYGLNVQEAEGLRKSLTQHKMADHGHIQTGADEVACCLIARWMSQSMSQSSSASKQRKLKIYPFYSSDQGRKLVARFDGVPIEAIVQQQAKACGAEIVKKSSDADLWLIVHTPDTFQGDHCERLRAKVDEEQRIQVLSLLKKAFDQEQPVMVADVAYANGSDPILTERILQELPSLTGLYGYAGWNTPGNTIGTAIAMGIVRKLAEEKKKFNAQAFNTLLMIRLADDWLYQSDVRYQIREMASLIPDEKILNVSMASGLELLQRRLGLDSLSVHCRFPCQRTFEIEVATK